MVARGGRSAGGRGRRNNSRAWFGVKPGRTGRMRVSDEGRERTVAVLRERALDGCLTLDTFAGRVDAAYRAKTIEELDVLVADLPREGGGGGVAGRVGAGLGVRDSHEAHPALEFEVGLPADAETLTVGR